MKIGKKILTFLIVLCSAILVGTACGSPYKKMSLSVDKTEVTQEFANDASLDTFTLTATVSGVKASQVDTGVVFSIADKRVVDFATSSNVIDGSQSTRMFQVLSTGRTTITINSEEGGKSIVVPVTITQKITGLSYSYSTMPLIRGQSQDITSNIYNGSQMLVFTPSLTTDRQVTLSAMTNSGVPLEDGYVEITGSTIKVLDTAPQSFQSFKLRATSQADDSIYADVNVTVLNKIDYSSLNIKQVTLGSEIVSLNYDTIDDIKTYSLGLSNSASMNATEGNKSVGVFDDDNVDMGTIYTISAKNINATHTAVLGLSSFSARYNSGEHTFSICEGNGNVDESMTIYVSYKGFEDFYEPAKLVLNVSVATYPNQINFVENMSDTESVDSILVYKNYETAVNGASVKLQLRNANGVIINQKAYVYVWDTVNNAIANNQVALYYMVGSSMRSITSSTQIMNGETIYIKCLASTDFVDDRYVLMARSCVYSDLTTDVTKTTIKYVNSDINLQLSDMLLERYGQAYITEDIFSDGMPTNMSLSDLTILSSDESIATISYSEPDASFVITSVGKIGSVTITATSPNGTLITAELVVYMQTNETNTSIQINNYSITGKQYASETDVRDIVDINIISGTQLSASIIIDGDEYKIVPTGLQLTSSIAKTTAEMPNVITISYDNLTIFTLDATGSAILTYKIINNANTLLPTTVEYNIRFNVVEPINTISVDARTANLYTTNSVSIASYQVEGSTYKTINISTTPNRALSAGNSFIIQVLYNGSFQSDYTISGSTTTYRISAKGSPRVLIEKISSSSYRISASLEDTFNESFSFYVYIGYQETYTNAQGDSYVVAPTTYSQITVKNATKVNSITTDILTKVESTSAIVFNTNKLSETPGDSTYVKTFKYTLSPNKSTILFPQVELMSRESSLSFVKVVSGDVITFTCTYFVVSIDNKTNVVTITLNAEHINDCPVDSSLYLVASDSITGAGNAQTYKVTSAFEVRVNNGTADAPFDVSTATDVYEMANDLSAYYKLTNDINLSLYNSSNGWRPIGNETAPFTGSLDGNNFKISGLSVFNNESTGTATALLYNYVGLFGYIGKTGVVKNLTLTDFIVRVYYQVSGDSDVYIGAMCGYNLGTISNCSIIDADGCNYATINMQLVEDGVVTEKPLAGVAVIVSLATDNVMFIGGVTGINAGTISGNNVVYTHIYAKDYSSSGKIYAGGVAGLNHQYLTDSVVDATIGDDDSNMEVITIINANYNLSKYSLTNPNSSVGGIVGLNMGIIKNVYARSFINGYNNVGGIAGTNYNSITNTIVIPTISGNSNVGGVVGFNVNGTYTLEYLNINTIDTWQESVRVTDEHVCNAILRYNRIQFSDALYYYSTSKSYLNTGIVGENAVGGIVGLFYGNTSYINVSYISTSANYFEYNSVQSYYSIKSTNDVSYRQSVNLTNYNTTDSSNAFFGDIVITSATGFGGGLIGIANDVVLSNNYFDAYVKLDNASAVFGGSIGKISGKLYVYNCIVYGSTFGGTHVGGLIGDSTELYDTYADQILGSTSSTNVAKLNSTLPTTYSNDYLYDNSNYGSFYYNINASVSGLKIAGTSYVNNFAYAGETKSGEQEIVVGIISSSTVDDTTTYTIKYLNKNGTSLEFASANYASITSSVGVIKATANVTRSNLLVANSFYNGYQTNVFKNSDSSTTFKTFNIYSSSSLDLSNFNYSAVSGNNISKYDNLKNYDITLVDAIDSSLLGDGQNLTYVSVGEAVCLGNYDLTNVYLNSDDQNFKLYQVTTDEDNNGLEDTNISDENIAFAPYDLYYNNDVNGGLPLPFANARGYYDYYSENTNTHYVDLIIDLAPTSILSDVVDTYAGVNLSNNDEKILSLLYNSIDYETNKYLLNNVLDTTILPPFVMNTKIKYESSNLNVFKIENDKIITTGCGVAQLTISSTLDVNLRQTITIVVNANATNTTTLYNNTSNSEVYLLRTGVTPNAEQLSNNYVTTIKGYTTTLEMLNTDTQNKYGVLVTSGDLTSEQKQAFSINGISFVDATRMYINSSTLVFSGLNALDSTIQLSLTPYIYQVANNQTYMYFLETCGSFEYMVANGTFSMTIPNDMTINPTTSETYDVVLNTDNADAQLIVNINDNENVFGVGGSETTSAVVDKLYLSQSCLYDETTKTKTFSFYVSVDPEEQENIFQKYNIRISYTTDIVSNGVITSETQSHIVHLVPQEISTVVLTHYSNVAINQTLSDKSDVNIMSGYKYSSNSLVPGYSGILQIDLHPSFGQYSYLKVTSSVSGVTLGQLVELKNTGEYSLFTDYTSTVNITNGVRIDNKVSKAITDKVLRYTYNGKIYIKTTASSSLAGGIATLVVTGYASDDEQLFVSTISLNIVALPQITLLFGTSVSNGSTSAVMAYGCSENVYYTVSNYDSMDIETVNGNLNATTTPNVYKYTNNPFGSSVDEIFSKIAENNTYSIKITAFKTIDSKTYSVERVITLRIVRYEITGYHLDKNEISNSNNYLNGSFNTIYKLIVKLDYEVDDYFLTNDTQDRVINEIKALENQINRDTSYNITGTSTYSNALFRYADADGYSNYVLTATSGSTAIQTLSNYIIRINKNNELTIQNTNPNATDILGTEIYFTYLNWTKDTNNNISTYDPYDNNAYASVHLTYASHSLNNYDDAVTERSKYMNGNLTDEVKIGFTTVMFSNDYTCAFTYDGNEDKPVPIFDVDDFTNMSSGVDYILQSDLVLNDWTAIEGKFASLDGNSFVIRINNFAKVKANSTTIGLFNKINGETTLTYEDGSSLTYTPTVKNLTVEIPSDITINVQDYNQITFGVIAAENEGIITNTNVVNIDGGIDLRIERNGMIEAGLNSGINYATALSYKELCLLRGISQEDIDRMSENEVKSSALSDNNKANNPTIKLDVGTSTSEVKGNNVSGFVAINSGFITNSSVDHVSIQGTDYVAGFVCQNSGSISSSFFKSANVINVDSASKASSYTAGFVCNNTANGKIQYSYSMGLVVEYNEGHIISNNITGNDMSMYSAYVGYAYSAIYNLESFASLRAYASIIRTNNFAGGFTYTNSGYISNCYSNFLINANNGAAGFSRINNLGSQIEYCYSMSSGNGDTFIPFGLSNNNSINDCFYLYVDSQDTINEAYQDLSTMAHQGDSAGTSLNAGNFGDYNAFQYYAFNDDNYTNGSESVTSAVWFIPNDLTGNDMKQSDTLQTYFKETSYSINRPELVSANLRGRSYRIYQSTEGNTDGNDYYYITIAQYDDEKRSLSADDKVSSPIGYGESIINPYLVTSATKFNNVTTLKIADNSQVERKIRLISDITFNLTDTTAKTSTLVFTGDIDGNGLDINNLRIVASTGNVSSFGMFSEICGGYVRNLNIHIEEIYGVNVSKVGVLAGTITDYTDKNGEVRGSKIFNIVVDGEDILVQGLNAVGGVAGYIDGNTIMVNVKSNVSVKANYAGSFNYFSALTPNATKTLFYTYDPEYTQSSDNISNVSYVGGIAGIVNVEKNPESVGKLKKYDRIRRVSAGGNISLSGKVVGGLFGYFGSDSNMANSYFEVSTQTRINATRIAGGLVGENRGTINRSYVAHADTVQDVIDTYIKNNQSRLDNATTDITISNVNYSLYGQNPHFMGGLVGFNNNGNINDSYNKVPVVNINAEYAGGIIGLAVGGTLDSVYTTADVYAFTAVGGIIGIRTYYSTINSNVKGYVNNASLKTIFAYFANYTFPKNTNNTNEIVTTTLLEDVVASNIWLYNHTNVKRGQYGNIDSNDAYLGTIAGVSVYCDTNKSSDGISYGFGVSASTQRFLSESIFTKTQYSFSTLNGSSVVSIVPEIGFTSSSTNTTDKALLDGIKGTETSINFVSSDDTKAMLYAQNGFAPASISYQVSRMQVLGSSRSLSEIINRMANIATANTFYRKYCGSDKENTNNSATYYESRIYYGWSKAKWDGVGVSVETGELSDSYVFPNLSNKVNPSRVLVYTATDLALMDEYPDATFILQNDILITGVWQTKCTTEENAFAGKLISSIKSEDEYNCWTISGEAITSSCDVVGLLGYVHGATFEHFNLAINYIYNSESSGYVYAGMLFGRGVSSEKVTIDNVYINYHHALDSNVNYTVNYPTNDLTSSITDNDSTSFEIQYVGAIAGKIENGVISNVKVRNFTYDVTAAIAKNETNVGGVVGYFSQNASDSDSSTENIEIDNISINISSNIAYTINRYIGGVMGNCTQSTIVAGINNIDAKNISINVTSNVSSSNGTNYIGGLFGNASAVLSNAHINETTLTSESFINLNIYKGTCYVGGLVGKLNGGINNANVELISTKPITIISKSNPSSYVGGVLGNADNTGNYVLSNIQIANGKISVSISNQQNFIGGLAGATQNYHRIVDNVTSGISNCYARGFIIECLSKTGSIGGLVGQSTNCSYVQCVVYDSYINNQTSSADTTSVYIGGLIGKNKISGFANLSGTYVIQECMANNKTITTIRNANIGGLVGGTEDSSSNNNYSLSVLNCYTTGSIMSRYFTTGECTNQLVGGIIGSKNKSNCALNITSSYSIVTISFASVNATTKGANYNVYTNSMDTSVYGGIIASGDANVTNSYYLSEYLPYSTKVGTGLTVSELLYNGTLPTGLVDVWATAINEFPTLSWIDSTSFIDDIQSDGTYVRPHVYASSATIGSFDYKSVIVDSSDIIIENAPSLNGQHVYFKKSINDNYDYALFTAISYDSSIYGLNATLTHNSIAADGKITKNDGALINCNIEYYYATHLIVTNNGIIVDTKLSYEIEEYTPNPSSTIYLVKTNAGVIDYCELTANSNINNNYAKSAPVKECSNGSILHTKMNASNLALAQASPKWSLTGYISNSYIAYCNNDADKTVNCYRYLGSDTTINDLSVLQAKYLSSFDNEIYDMGSRDDGTYPTWVFIKNNTVNSGAMALAWEYKDNYYDSDIKSDYFFDPDTTIGTSGSVDITSAQQLQYVINNGENGIIINILNNIDLSGKVWLGNTKNNSEFKGTIDGKGHTITGLSTLYGDSFINSLGATSIKALIFVESNTSGALLANNASFASLSSVGFNNCSVMFNTTCSMFGNVDNTTINNCYARYVNASSNGSISLIGLIKVKNSIDMSSSYFAQMIIDGTSIITKTQQCNWSISIDMFRDNVNSKSNYILSTSSTSFTYYKYKTSSLLQSEQLDGFDWGAIWMRLSTGANTGNYDDSLPCLMCNVTTWIDTVGYAHESAYDSNTTTYTISSANDLAKIARETNLGTFDGKTITLNIASNIDLGGHIWVPIGRSYGTNFIVNGNSKSISNMICNAKSISAYDNVSADSLVGLFGFVTSLNVNSLCISNAYINVNGNVSYVGLLAGLIEENEGKEINNVYSKASSISGSTTSTSRIGGLIGDITDGTIQNIGNSSADVSIYINSTKTLYIGGLIGSSGGLKYSNISTYSVDIYSTQIGSGSRIGGMVGYALGTSAVNFNTATTIEAIYGTFAPTIVVNSNNSTDILYVGGVVGYANLQRMRSINSEAEITITNTTKSTACAGGVVGYLTSSYADALYHTVGGISSSADNVGGVVGYLNENSTLEATSNSSYVEGRNYVGGVVGYIYTSSLYEAQNTGNVKGTAQVGGVVGGSALTSNNRIINIQAGYYFKSGMIGQSSLSNTITIKGSTYVGSLIGYSATADYIKMGSYNISLDSNAQYAIGNLTKVIDIRGCYLLNYTDFNSSAIVTYTSAWSHKLLPGADGSNVNTSLYSYSTYNGTSYTITSSADWTEVVALVCRRFGDLPTKSQSYNINVILENAGTKITINYGSMIYNYPYNRMLGNQYIPYCGIFNGNGNTIEYNGYYACDYSGLFGSISGATIRSLNVTMTSGLSSSDCSNIGGVVGKAVSSTISNVTLNQNGKNILGKDYVGGLIGYASGCTLTSLINNTTTASTITGINLIGGIIGKAENTTIDASSTTSNVTITYIAGNTCGTFGGIIGDATNCIIGEDGAISNNATINAVGFNNVGGIIGQCSGTSTSACIVKNATNGGAVNGGQGTGGIVGFANYTTITSCTNTGTINSGKYYSVIGGIVGYVDTTSTITSNTNSGFIYGNSYVSGVVGKDEPETSTISGNTMSGRIYTNVQSSDDYGNTISLNKYKISVATLDEVSSNFSFAWTKQTNLLTFGRVYDMKTTYSIGSSGDSFGRIKTGEMSNSVLFANNIRYICGNRAGSYFSGSNTINSSAYIKANDVWTESLIGVYYNPSAYDNTHTSNFSNTYGVSMCWWFNWGTYRVALFDIHVYYLFHQVSTYNFNYLLVNNLKGENNTGDNTFDYTLKRVQLKPVTGGSYYNSNTPDSFYFGGYEQSWSTIKGNVNSWLNSTWQFTLT